VGRQARRCGSCSLALAAATTFSEAAPGLLFQLAGRRRVRRHARRDHAELLNPGRGRQVIRPPICGRAADASRREAQGPGGEFGALVAVGSRSSCCGGGLGGRSVGGPLLSARARGVVVEAYLVAAR